MNDAVAVTDAAGRSFVAESDQESVQSSSVLDGRQLFKMVKSRISTDKFQKFLKIIKALNSQNISKDEAILQIKNDVLGEENKDVIPILY